MRLSSRIGVYSSDNLYDIKKADFRFSFSKLKYRPEIKEGVIPQFVQREEMVVLKHLRSIEGLSYFDSNCKSNNGNSNDNGNGNMHSDGNGSNVKLLEASYNKVLHSKQCNTEIPLKASQSKSRKTIEIKPFNINIPELNLNQISKRTKYNSHSNRKTCSNTNTNTNTNTKHSNLFITLHSNQDTNKNNTLYHHRKFQSDINKIHINHHTYIHNTTPFFNKAKKATQTRINHRAIDKPQVQSYSSMKQLKFPMKKYKALCTKFLYKENETNRLSERLNVYRDIIEPKQATEIEKEKEKKKLRDLIKETGHLSKSRNIGAVRMKTTGISNMVTKANADLMNFGDNYLKMHDTEFYHRSKDIFNDYEQVRQNADIDCGTDLNNHKTGDKGQGKGKDKEKGRNRLSKIKRNQFLITKTFNLMTNEHSKFMYMLDNCIRKKKNDN